MFVLRAEATEIRAISLRLPVSLLERIKVAASGRRPLSVADQDAAIREGGGGVMRFAWSGTRVVFG